MKISNELRGKIDIIFQDNERLKEQLLYGDAGAIRKIGSMAQKGMAPEDIIKAYEKDHADQVYKKAKIMVEMKEIYKELCEAYEKSLLEER